MNQNPGIINADDDNFAHVGEVAETVVRRPGQSMVASQQQTNALVTPMAMIDRALASGAAPETLEKLLALQERWEATQARKAFDEAIALAKAQIAPVVKNKSGHNDKRYADFAAIARVVDPVISEHGLSYRFRTKQDDRIHVTCILSHRAGHSEETTLAGPADASGSKNAIQAIGSTLTYLQRYSLTQALGLAVADDDDGRAAGFPSGPINEEQLERMLALLSESGADTQIFCEKYKIEAVKDLPASKFEAAYGDVDRWFQRQKQKVA